MKKFKPEGKSNIRFREHRGNMAESLATTVEIQPTRAALWAILQKVWGANLTLFMDGPQDIIVRSYHLDNRNGWDMHVVTNKNNTIFGWTDGPIID